MLEFKNEHKMLFLVMVLTFLFSFSYALYYKIQPKVDALAYDNIGWNLATGNGYREAVSVSVGEDNAIARVGPLYEYFLASIYKIFGHNFVAIWFFQALLRALSTFFVYQFSLALFRTRENKERLALWSSAIFGFYPDLIEIGAMLMTETLYLFLFCLMLYIFFDFIKNESSDYFNVFVLGVSSGLAVLARPPILFSLPVIFFYLYRRGLLKQMAFFSLVLALVFTPWTFRNYNVYGEFMPFGAAGQLNFWIGNYHGGRGEQEASKEIEAFSKTHPIKELSNESIKQFKNFVIQYPGEFVKITLLRINKYFSIIRPMGFWFYTSGWGQILFVVSSVLGSVFLFVFGLAGIIKMFKDKQKEFFYLLAFIVSTPLILFITVVETRYRFQIYPLLAPCAAYFITGFDFKNQTTYKLLLISVLLVFLNGGVDLLMSMDRFLGRINGWL